MAKSGKTLLSRGSWHRRLRDQLDCWIPSSPLFWWGCILHRTTELYAIVRRLTRLYVQPLRSDVGHHAGEFPSDAPRCSSVLAHWDAMTSNQHARVSGITSTMK